MKTKLKKLTVVLSIIYAAIMLWLLFGQRFGFVHYDTYMESIKQSINLVPFYTINNYIRMLSISPNAMAMRHYFINLAGNIVMFIPLGFFIPALFRRLRSFLLFMLTAVSTIVCIEIIQLFTLLGSCDVDDLILNIVGAVIGYLIYFIASRIIK